MALFLPPVLVPGNSKHSASHEGGFVSLGTSSGTRGSTGVLSLWLALPLLSHHPQAIELNPFSAAEGVAKEFYKGQGYPVSQSSLQSPSPSLCSGRKQLKAG